MAQKKISELTSTTKLNDDNIIPLVQDGVTKHIRYGDMKAPLVKEVEAEVEDYVDNKLTGKTNYVSTTMVRMGFTRDSYVPVRDFWSKIKSYYGSHGVVQFEWNAAEGAKVGNANSSAPISGGTLIYTCSGISAWRNFSAIYFSGYSGEVYHIQCSIGSDTTAGNESWTVNRLPYSGEVLSVRSSLLDVSKKLDYMYNRYPSQGKVIGKWHDGRNIWRVVYLAKDLTVTSAYANGGTVYGFTGGLTKQRDVDLFLSAKIHWKSSATLQDMDILLANDDCLFTRSGANSSVSTENVDCLVVEFVEK